ncbi:hypothetical protein QQ045_018426 [Rhodiola kirilowii]
MHKSLLVDLQEKASPLQLHPLNIITSSPLRWFFTSSIPGSWLVAAAAAVIFEGCELHKKHEMKVAGSIWKNFKSRLAREYIHGDKATEDPLVEYKYLDKDTWKMFKEQQLYENAMKLRETNKELVKKNVYAHILGRGGYRKLEDKLTTEKIAELYVTIERHELWKRGRKMKNDEFVTEASQRVATKIDELVVRSSQGQFSSQNQRHDILTEVIGTPEPKGLTRGVGSHIPWRVGLPISTSSGGTPSSSNIRRDVSDHCIHHCPIDSDPWKNIPEGGLKSLLYIEGQLEGDKQLVDIGQCVNGRFVNFRAIPKNNVKRKVDKALLRGRGAALPTAHPKLSNVQQAVNHHMAWPKDLVVVDKRSFTRSDGSFGYQVWFFYSVIDDPNHREKREIGDVIRDIIAYVRANNGAEVEDISQYCFPNGVESYEVDKILEVRDEIAGYLRDYVTTHFARSHAGGPSLQIRYNVLINGVKHDLVPELPDLPQSTASHAGGHKAHKILCISGLKPILPKHI